MIVPALLVFFVTFGVMGSLIALVSTGTAPLWLLAGGPLLMSSWLSIAMLRSGRPEPARSPRRERLVRQAEAVSERLLLVLGMFLPFSMIGLLVVVALPLHGRTESFVGIIATAVSIICAVLVTRDAMSPNGACA